MKLSAIKIKRSEPVLVIDLQVQGGTVTIPGTRIPARTIAGSVWAEGSVSAAREDYPGPSRVQVLTACIWYVDECRSMARPTKEQRAIIEAWGDWADDAFRILATTSDQRCPSPPRQPDSNPPRAVASAADTNTPRR